MKKNIFFCALFVSLLTSFVTACDLLPGMGPSSGDPTPPPVEDDITPTPPPVEEEDEIAPTVIASISAGIVNQKAQFSYTVSDNVTKTEDLEVTVSLKLGEVDVAYDSNNEFIPTQAGDYVLTVSAQDEEGNVGTDTQTVTVDANGSFVCEEGTPDVGVTIATDMKSLAISDAFHSATEVVATSNYFIDGLVLDGEFQLNFTLSAMSIAAECETFPKLFVKLLNDGEGTDSIWVESKLAMFGAHNITGDDAWKNGNSGALNPLPTEENDVSIIRYFKEDATWYGVLYNGVLVDMFEKTTAKSDLISCVSFAAESMAVTVSNVNVVYFRTEEDKTAEYTAIDTYFTQLANSVFDRDHASGASFAGEFDTVPTVTLQKGGYNYAYFKGTYGKYFVAQTTLLNIQGQQAGIVLTDGTTSYSLFTDGKANDSTTLMSNKINNNVIVWPYQYAGSYEYYIPYDGTTNVKLTVVRENTFLYYFVNDAFLGSREISEFDNKEITVALGNNCAETQFTEFSVTSAADIDELETLYAGYTDVSSNVLNRRSIRGTVDYTNEDKGEITITALNNTFGYVYFKETVGQRYSLKATLDSINSNRGGLIFATLNDGATQYAIMTDSSDESAETLMLLKIDKSNVIWPFQNLGSFEAFAAYKGNGAVQMEVIRDGINFYFLIDGNCIAMREIADLGTNDTQVALISQNSTTMFSDYSLTESEVTVPSKFSFTNMVNNVKNPASQYSYYAYKQYGTYFTYSADVKLPVIGSGQAGIMYAMQGDTKYFMQLDSKNVYEGVPTIMFNHMKGTTLYWPGNYQQPTFDKRIAYDASTAVNLKVVRNNAEFYFFVDDVYMGMIHLAEMKDLSTYIGFITGDQAVEYSNVTITTRTEAQDMSSYLVKETYNATANKGTEDIVFVSTGTVTVEATMSDFVLGSGNKKLAVDFFGSTYNSGWKFMAEKIGLDINMNSAVSQVDWPGNWKNSAKFASTVFDVNNPPESVKIKVQRAIKMVEVAAGKTEARAVFTIWINDVLVENFEQLSGFTGPVKGCEFILENVSAIISNVSVKFE